MIQYETEAVLLATRNIGEADKMVTLFSREYGKITAMAFGARHPRSRLSGGMQPFTHADLALSPGKTLDSIRQCEIRNPFRRLREDLMAMAYGTFLAELSVELCPERQPEPVIFDVLLSAFGLMAERNPRLVALAAGWQILALVGLCPEYEHCVECGGNLNSPVFFSSEAGGVVCAACAAPQMTEFGPETGLFLKTLLTLDWETPGHFTVSGAVLAKMEQIFIDYVTNQVDKSLKSLEFIKQVAVSGRKSGG